MPKEWIDKEVQGRRRLCLVIDDTDWHSVSESVAEFWDRLFTEAEQFGWSAMYVTIQPDYGFNFYLHAQPAAVQPAGRMLDGPRFELEISRMETDFDKPDEEHPALREAAWESIERALASTSVLSRFEALRAEGRFIRGGEWDARNGYPRQLDART